MGGNLALLLVLVLTAVGQVPSLPLGGSDWSEGHERILAAIFELGTEEEKWIVSNVPNSFAEKFRDFDAQDLARIHPDILWRIPDQMILNSTGFSGKVLADLVRLRGTHDLAIVRKAGTVLQRASTSTKLEFLEILDSQLTRTAWVALGEFPLSIFHHKHIWAASSRL